MTIMRGATNARNMIIDYLSEAMPIAITTARDEWGLDAYQLPTPADYSVYEPYALDKYPQIGVNIVNANEFQRKGWNSNEDETYLVEYQARIFLWVRTPMDSNEKPMIPEYDETIRLRDDMASVLRSVLLTSPSLGTTDKILWDENTLSEEYSDIQPVKGDRFVAGVTMDFVMSVDEDLQRSILGTADTISVTESDILED